MLHPRHPVLAQLGSPVAVCPSGIATILGRASSAPRRVPYRSRHRGGHPVRPRGEVKKGLASSGLLLAALSLTVLPASTILPRPGHTSVTKNLHGAVYPSASATRPARSHPGRTCVRCSPEDRLAKERPGRRNRGSMADCTLTVEIKYYINILRYDSVNEGYPATAVPSRHPAASAIWGA